MGTIRRALFLIDPVSEVKKAIGAWFPEMCESEADYEDSLYEFLHEHFNDVQITKQYGIGRSRADLNVGDRVLIEIKKDLQNKTDYDRLIGQLADYMKWKGATIILLVGRADPNLKKELIQHAKDRGSFRTLYDPAFDVIEKKTI
ncbi:MAG TPA: hypothetical protein VLJ16_11965 [Acidobacteriota bacterium]|nr:hypothetical protein [Acidobacteriota bacterium]